MLAGLFPRLFPECPVPSTTPELVKAFLSEDDLLRDYYMSQTQAGAKAAITFALASGIDGDFDKAYEDVPRKPDGKKVALKPFADRAGKLAKKLADLVTKIAAARALSNEAASTAP